ncbi:MAG TPA: site-specific integrase [Candidatus Bathyarchaeia archaeon]|nr:site-specific integrase [Candidatus Bathyarchaeia archaeon]
MFSLFSDNLILSKCFDRFLEYMEANCLLSASSLKKYKEIFPRIIHFFGDISIKKLDVQLVTGFKKHLNQPSGKKKELSASYKNHHLSLMRNVLKFEKEIEGLKVMDFNLITKFKVSIKEVECLVEKELAKVVKYPSDKTITGTRLRAFTEISISTGCRLSEVLNLKISDIDFENGVANIRTKGDKPHMIFFTESSLDAIKKYLAMRKDHHPNLFVTATPNPKPWQANDVERSLRMIGKKLGFKKNLRPHLLRKSAATILYKNNTPLGEIQRFLNHSSARTTLTHYLGNANYEDLKINHKRIMDNLNF